MNSAGSNFLPASIYAPIYESGGEAGGLGGLSNYGLLGGANSAIGLDTSNAIEIIPTTAAILPSPSLLPAAVAAKGGLGAFAKFCMGCLPCLFTTLCLLCLATGIVAIVFG